MNSRGPPEICRAIGPHATGVVATLRHMHSLLATATTTADVNYTGLFIASVIGFVIGVLPLWVVFNKAGEAGWQALIPIWNTLVLLKITGKPWWWILLFWVPFLGLVLAILMLHALSLSFGHGGGFTVGL